MGNGFGLYPEVKLGGEAEFKKALSSINKDLNVLTSELKLSSAEYGNNNDSMEALTSKAEILNDRLDKQWQQVGVTQRALEKMKETYGENSDKVKEWQIKLNNAEAQLAKTRDEIDKNNKAIEELGKQEKAIEKIKNSFDELKSKTENVKDKLEPVESTLKNIGSISVKGLTTGIATATAAVGGLEAAAVKTAQAVFTLTSGTAEAGKEILVMSERTGLSTKAYQEWDYIAKQAGTTMDTLQGGITDLAEKMDDAAKGEGEAAEIFKKLGVNVTDSTGKLKSQEKVFEETIKALQGVTNETERQALATKLMSTTGEELLPLLNGEIGSLEELKQAANDYGLVMSDSAIDASVKFNNSLTLLKGSVSALKNDLAADFLPGITEIMDGFTALLSGEEGAPEKIKQGIENTIAELDEFIPEVLTLIEDVAPELGEAAVELVGALTNGLLNNSDKVIETADNLLDELSTSLFDKENLTKMSDAGIDLVIELASGALDATPNIIDAAFTLLDGLMNALLDDENMDDLAEVAVDLVLQLGVGLIGATPELIEAAFKLAGSLVEALLNYDWRALGSQIWAKIKNSITGDAEKTAADGSHAIGMPYVPYDNYLAQLHEGERILTAAENEAYTSIKAMSANNMSREDVAALRSDLQAIAKILNGGIPVDVSNPRDIGRAVKQSA